ncbi:MAG: hypothetical protein GY786_16065 [Proteobacteria bacterium]|nr:hypothetical protein [Pseudomonadota bacterium]
MRLLLIVFIVTIILPPGTILGQENDFSIRTGTHQQYSSLSDSSYGKFIKERYGVSGLTTKGTQNSFLFTLEDNSKLRVGLEQGELTGKIKYKDLNGVSRVNDIGLSWLALLLNYALNEKWELEGGFGTNLLTREFYGYGDNYIHASNYRNNTGRSNTKTRGTQGFGQVNYNLFNRHSDFFQIVIAYRYTYGATIIRLSDDRPALSSKGVPEGTVFETGGHLGLVQLGINF